MLAAEIDGDMIWLNAELKPELVRSTCTPQEVHNT